MTIRPLQMCLYLPQITEMSVQVGVPYLMSSGFLSLGTTDIEAGPLLDV